VRLLFLADEAPRVAALHQRTVDWYSSADVQGLLAADPGLAQDYRRVVYDPPTVGAYVVQWNTRRSKLADARVRTALGMLFDRRGIAERILAGSARPAAAFAKAEDSAYPRDLEPLPLDPVRARQLLRDAGFDAENGTALGVRLLVPAEAPLYQRMAATAEESARAAGVELELQVIPYRDLMMRRAGTDWDGAMLLASVPSLGDPYELFHSSGGRNPTGWGNARADELLTAARIEVDAERRAALLREFHHIVATEQPMALLVHPLADMLVNVHLQGCEPGPLGLWPERFWVPPEFQRKGP
jgi:ABC-type transport system substrate-binding protein